METTNNAAATKPVAAPNFRQIGSDFAAGSAKLASIAQRVIDGNGVADAKAGTLKDEARDGIKAGMQVCFCESDKPVTYVREGHDSYRALGADEKLPKGKGLKLTASYAVGMSGRDFGKLKGEQPNLHALIKAKRDRISNLISTSYGRLLQLIKTPEGRGTRGEIQDWAARVAEVFETLKKGAKNARTRGDTTVPDSDAKIATAFKTALKALTA